MMSSNVDQAFVVEATLEFERALRAVAEEYGSSGRDLRPVLGSAREFATRAVRATVPVVSPWDELVGPFFRSEGVQARLGISRQAVAAKAGRRRLLRVVTSDGDHLYPVWQFDAGGAVPGLAEVLALFDEEVVDGWTLAAWLRTADPELQATPMDLITGGQVVTVVDMARLVAGGWAA